MKTNLSSQISLHRVSPRYYRPENAFEKSVLTRLEKIPTDIYESVEEGANYIAREIAQTIREKQKAGRFCVLALPGLKMEDKTRRFVTATHKTSAKGWAKERGFSYLPVHNDEELTSAMAVFTQSAPHNQPMLMEVFTDASEDVRLLKEYFHQLKK